ncbi:hypothetical protein PAPPERLAPAPP_01320 [Brevundimonas phage vB_BpoS-Papperlapapp]|uniref:Uncharacterized protein n=1 Tax=Brevundimonas phage vB_BpoS-Kabachok TaxID=2948600 RepID=A0A9E7MQB0_9CAUD|nr:hypothetical protein KABACHOK_05550 [Brevundimonas phage vB_BpoS-Kabachok]USN15874.1 hypothetical protein PAPPERLAPAPP_01320 [Brevundimonas phage vB_BpoS-Papperlapapp]
MTTLAKLTAETTVPDYSPLTAQQIAALTVMQFPHTEPAALVAEARAVVDALEEANAKARAAYEADAWAVLTPCDPFTRGYIGAAASNGAEYPTGHPAADSDRDNTICPEEIHPDGLREMVADCERFQRENAATLEAAYASGEVRAVNCSVQEQAGYDFYMTRTRNGVGFWEDGDWPEAEGEALTEAAQKYPEEVYLYTADDGTIQLG